MIRSRWAAFIHAMIWRITSVLVEEHRTSRGAIPIAKPTRQTCRTSKFRARHGLPGSAPAFAASAMNSFRRGPHAATAHTDPKIPPNFRAHGRSCSAPAFDRRRARWHSALAREVTNRRECPGPGFRDWNMISCKPEPRTLSQNGCILGAFLFLKISDFLERQDLQEEVGFPGHDDAVKRGQATL